MCLRQICTVLVCLTSIFSTAQESTHRKQGIYKTYQELLDNNPSILKPFAFMVDTSIDFERHDTGFSKPTFRYIDNKKRVKKVWGLCDSGIVYANIKDQGFLPISFVGRYSFIEFDEKNKIRLWSPFFGSVIPATIANLSISGLDNLLSPSKNKLLYFKENGDAIFATDQSIAWLLRKEKELSAAFEKEPKSNFGVYKKYLQLMNRKYPLTK